MIKTIRIDNPSGSTAVATVTGLGFEPSSKFSVDGLTTFPQNIAIGASLNTNILFDETANTGNYSEVVKVLTPESAYDVSITVNAIDAYIPAVVPTAIDDLVGVLGSTIVDLSWTAPFDGGAYISGYNIYKDSVVIANVNSLSYQVTGLTNGTLYEFTVNAVNSIGESLSSNVVSITPENVLTVPSAITDFVASDLVRESVSVTFSNSIGNPEPTYNLVNGAGTTVATGISSGYAYAVAAGTDTYHVDAINSQGTTSSNTDSGTALAPAAPNFYMEFEDNLVDSSGGALVTVTTGTPTYVTGQVGKAINLDGSTSLDFSDMVSGGGFVTPLTMELYINISADPSSSGHIYNIDSSCLYIESGKIVAQGKTAAASASQVSSFSYALNTTYKIKVIENVDDTLPPSLYIDDVLQADARFNDYWLAGGYEIGVRSGSTTPSFTGWIDEFKVFSS